MSKIRPCALCKQRPRTIFVTASDVCEQCYEYSGWENTHSDEGHDEFQLTDYARDQGAKILDSRDHCPICQGVPAPWTTTEEPDMPKTTAAPKTRTNPTTRHMSHASCSHPRTPAGRAACRKAIRGALAPAPAAVPTHVMLGKSTTVHVPGGCTTTRKHDGAIHRTDDAVTCKNCLKTLATVDA